MPVDGVSGATRNVGQHELLFKGTDAPLAPLTHGSYQLVIEAAREGGGRELLRVPFDWPVKKTSQNSVQGQEELGKVTVTVKPYHPKNSISDVVISGFAASSGTSSMVITF